MTEPRRETLAMPLSTVSAVLSRRGMGRLGRIGLEPPVRYERSRPGELVHIDVKKLGRIEGGAGKRVSGRTPGPSRRDRLGARPRRCRTITAGSPTPRCCPTNGASTAIWFLERALTFFAAIVGEDALDADDVDVRAYVSAIHALACPPTRARQSASSARSYIAGSNGAIY
jgi:hypothetical protein